MDRDSPQPGPAPSAGSTPATRPDPSTGFHRPTSRGRRVALPVALFVVTSLSTFWAGAVGMQASGILVAPLMVGDVVEFLQVAPPSAREALWLILQERLWEGFTYMAAVIAILLAHECGHFVFAAYYRVRPSLPYFIPMPLTPIGTLGAVIAMQGSRADRRQLFDIGLAGPLAGLVVALPIAWFAIQTAEPVPPEQLLPAAGAEMPDEQAGRDGAEQVRGLYYDDPLLFELMIAHLRPDVPHGELSMSPLLMAAWVGMLVTGLNMMPVSQLDGGHVIYALFGRHAHWLARLFVLVALVFMVVSETYTWVLMLLIVLLIGVSHPPTADDRVALGFFRRVLGLASLSIPVLCFPVYGIVAM